MDINNIYPLCELLVDPDAPSRTNQEFGEFLHWLVANIPGNTIGKGDELCEYVGSGPGKGSGRYHPQLCSDWLS